MRWAWADVDLDAIAHNVRTIRDAVAPAELWAVVKANAYGHGAVPVARAAIAAGATGLCVALVDEGIELRSAGVGGPILVLSEPPPEQLEALVAHRLTPTVYSPSAITALGGAARKWAEVEYPVHLKIDTGMHRVGAAPVDAVDLADLIASTGHLKLHGVFTHLAMADQPEDSANACQLNTLSAVLAELAAAGHQPDVVHAANSAGALALPSARLDLVRVGIAMYGLEPGAELHDACSELRPAMSLRARVSLVKRVIAGEGISYGLRHVFSTDTTVATVPLGYADGVPRRLFESGGCVLIGGIRRPIVGVVTMDQLMVACGDDEVVVGDEVVLIGPQIGEQGADEIRAEEWAEWLGTIDYEIVCGISQRIERMYA
jgi:alanine racemase